MTTPLPSPIPPRSRGAHTMPWLLSRLIIGLDGGSNLAAELRRSAGPTGIHDPERLSITLLGVMTYAMRAGCRPEQVRRFVDVFVEVVLGGDAAPLVLAREATG